MVPLAHSFLVGLELLIGVIMPGVRRHMHKTPPLPRGTSWWQGAAAHLAHFALYVLLFLIPFAGWLWANGLGWRVVAFWVLPMPTLVPKGCAYTWLASDAHVYLVVLICCLIALHILASLWHSYFKKDDVLERMLPEGKLTDRTLNYFDRFR